MSAKEPDHPHDDHHDHHDHADEAHEVQDRFLAGDRIGAAMALSTEVIDMCGIACTPGELESRVARFADGGADSMIAIVFGSDREATIRRLAALS